MDTNDSVQVLQNISILYVKCLIISVCILVLYLFICYSHFYVFRFHLIDIRSPEISRLVPILGISLLLNPNQAFTHFNFCSWSATCLVLCSVIVMSVGVCPVLFNCSFTGCYTGCQGNCWWDTRAGTTYFRNLNILCQNV